MSRPRRFRPSRAALFLAVLAPIILAAIIEGLWTAIVAFSGEAPPPSPTATPLPSGATPSVTATPYADMFDCPQEGLWGKVLEQMPTKGTVVHPTDFPPLAGATVRFPELGLEAVTDEQGCYSIAAPPIDEPRLLTLEFSAPRFGPVTHKNDIYYQGRGYGTSLKRGDAPVVQDFCTFQSPPLSAALQIHARLCVEAAVAPNYLMLGCPLPHKQQENILLASIVGSVVDAASGQPIGGATVAVREYQESRVTGGDGCFLFDPLVLPSAEGRLITVEVTAAGYRPLILEHFWLAPTRVADVKLEAGAESHSVDYCVFTSPPEDPTDKMQAQRCQRAGILVITDP